MEKIAKLSVKTQDSSFIAFHSIQCYIIDVLVFGQLAARLDGRKIDVFREEREESPQCENELFVKSKMEKFCGHCVKIF